MAQANPFAAPPAGNSPGDPFAQQSVQAGNPFGSFAAQPPAPSQTSGTFSAAMHYGNAGASPPQQQQQQSFIPQGQVQQQQQQQPQDPWQQFPPQQQQGFAPQQLPQQQYFVGQQQQQFTGQETPFQQQPPQQQPFPPAPVAPVPQQTMDPFSNALVPSAQPSNPYAQPMPQQSGNPFGGQAIVPAVQQQQSQWGVPGNAPVSGSGNPFDPFAPPPPAPPAPAPPSNELVPFAASQGNYQAPEFPFDPDNVAPVQEEPKEPESSSSVGPPVNEVNAVHGGHSVVSEPETTLTRRSDDRGGEIVPHRPSPPTPQNKYSQQLARNAPPGCAPLPKGELVVKSGYILARISFRTILMKKWKQTYWVQYGRHTMLWFRSENHFNEWLSNPYLSQAQRNFLVKLAINFVHDLYKPNVRGYQVTQCHTKPYGRKLIRQFKLERWMDYGPTIAAAFGSQDQREVDELRQTIIDCMRNTPLENGIRATGAVRQDYQYDQNGHGDEQYSYGNPPPRHGQHYEISNARLDGDGGYNRSHTAPDRIASAPDGGRSVVSEPNDFLDSQRSGGFDETASYGGYTSAQYNSYSQPPAQQRAYAYR